MTGICKECPEYQRTQGEGKSEGYGKACGPDKCNKKQVLLKAGSCKDCIRFTQAAADGLWCVPDTACTGG